MQRFGRAGLRKVEFPRAKIKLGKLSGYLVFPVLGLVLVTPFQEGSSWSFLPACVSHSPPLPFSLHWQGLNASAV